jgi:hypothetical protein
VAGKTYIKTGDATWSRVKKVYLKTGGITWQAVRKAYLKTGNSTWKKIYDTASNKPFIGNDIPKIRLNTPRTNSGLDFTGTANDPVNPIVEAGRVQQMGPPITTPTVGWPSGTIGNHLWGYNGDWESGNGSTITYIYQWLYNLTGNSNDNRFDPQFWISDTSSSRNTSSTGRADMLTNSEDYLGYNDGDYFDKNFLTFRVGASNSAGGPVFAESVPVYIVKQRPSGTMDLVQTNVDVPETLNANFTYRNEWYRKPDLANSYIEWFAVDSASDALTVNNRVSIQYLSSLSTTGTTIKSGTATHYAELPNKYYAVRITLNNSNTQSPVVPVSGFTPNSPFTAEDSTAPGSALEVSTLDILDIYSNAGTDNRDYIPAGGLMKIKSEVTGVDGSTTYRIRYRMYNWQNNSYYGMDGTNYGTAASSAWTTRTGSSTSFGSGGTLISNVSVSGTTATLIHNEVVSSSLFGSTTYAIPGGSSDRWMIEIEVSALKNSIRKYYADIVGGVNWYISRSAANLLFTAEPATAQVNSNITFSGSIGALGGGLSYPRQYRVVWGPGDVTEWLPVGEYGYGTSNPSFTITKQFSTAGEYYPYFQTIPDYSSGSTSVVISPTLSAPTPTGVVWNGTSFVISYTGGSGPWFQAWYRLNNTTYPADGTGFDSGTETQNTNTMTYTPGFTPTPGGTYYFWLRSALDFNSNTAGTNVSSYSATRVQVTIPQVATAPTSVTASNNGSSTTLTASWSGATFASFYRIYWGGATTSANPATTFDEEKAVNGTTITASSGSWAWGPGDPDKNGNTPVFNGNYYFYVSASANGTTWTPYVRSSTLANLAITAPTPTGVTFNGTSFIITFSGGSGPYYQLWWAKGETVSQPTADTGFDSSGLLPTSAPFSVTYTPSGVSTGEIWNFWLRSALSSTATTTGVDRSTYSSNYVTSTITGPAAFSMSIYDSTATPSTPSLTTSYTSPNVNIDWADDIVATGGYWSTISGGTQGFRQNARSVSNDFWSVTEGSSYTGTVYAINSNKSVTMFWGNVSGAQSYRLAYDIDGGTTQVVDKGSATSHTVTTSGAVRVLGIVAFSNSNYTGPATQGSYDPLLFVTPTNKNSNTANWSLTIPVTPIIPTISAITNSGVTQTQGTISWTSTNQASFSSNGTFSGTGTTGTSISKTGLTASTTYTGTVTVTSSTGNTASSNYSLRTSDPAANYNLNYNANGGTGTMTPTVGNGNVIIKSNGFSRTNCNFAGWNTNAAGTGTNYSAGGTFNLTADSTLYARWTAVANSATAPTGFKFDGNNLPTSGRKRWSWTGPGTVTGGTATGFRVQISSTSSTSGFSTVAESPLSIGARSYSVAVSPVTSPRWLRVAMVYTDGLGNTVNSPTFTAAL